MANEIFLTEAGVRIRFPFKLGAAAKDISAATAKECTLLPPSGVKKIKTTAQFETDGTDGILIYDTVASDIDEEGSWQAQGKVVVGGKEHFSEIFYFRGVKALEDH